MQCRPSLRRREREPRRHRTISAQEFWSGRAAEFRTEGRRHHRCLTRHRRQPGERLPRARLRRRRQRALDRQDRWRERSRRRGRRRRHRRRRHRRPHRRRGPRPLRAHRHAGQQRRHLHRQAVHRLFRRRLRGDDGREPGGFFHVTRKAAAWMLGAGSGHIVNITATIAGAAHGGASRGARGPDQGRPQRGDPRACDRIRPTRRSA